MITNDSLDFIKSNSTEERIRDIFNLVSAGYKVRSKPPAKKKRKDKPSVSAVTEGKVRIRILKRG